MPRVTQIVQMRSRRRCQSDRSPVSSHNPLMKLLAGIGASFGILVSLAGIAAALLYADLTYDLPAVESLPALLEPPNGALRQPTRLYDRLGEQVIAILRNPATAPSQYLRYEPGAQDSEEILPSSLITATLAASDPLFWKHGGYTLSSLRAEEHPTLAQKLVFEMLLQDEPANLRRALRERLLAAQVTATFGRPKVLEWYLNYADFGYLAFGADAAARLYLGKPASQINLAEAALLAVVAQEPTLNPFDAPQAALERQKRTIQAMLRYQTITPEQGIQAVREEVSILPPQALAFEADLAPALTHLALTQAATRMPRGRLLRGGMRILTTLDYDLQMQALCAVETQLARLQEQPTSVSEPEPVPDCDAGRLLPTLPKHTALPPGSLQSNLVVMEPQTGTILAVVGGTSGNLDGAPLPAHPPGSLATTFIYLTAFTRGLSPATLVWDTPSEAARAGVTGGDFQGPLRLRVALANDYRIPAETTLTQIGIENVLHTTQQLGIPSPQAAGIENPTAMTLFREMDLLEISQAFGVLANQGILSGRLSVPQPGANASQKNGELAPIQPAAAVSLEDYSGRIWRKWDYADVRPILTPQLAYLITNSLSDEPARWRSLGHPNALEIGRPAAAKTGHNLAGDNLWTVGFTPQRLVGVWLGRTASQPGLTGEETTILQKATAGLWHAIMQYATRSLPYQDWSIPAGLSNIQVCDPSGMLPTPDCPNVVNEIFLAGSEPIQLDRMYRRDQINRETGRLATVFTPPELIIEQVFLIVPSEENEWARQANLATPPDAYDFLPVELPSWPHARLGSPEMFAMIKGEVSVTGTAAGDQFSFYRIQVGKGLNPTQWYLVGKDSSQPVESGLLARWDTGGLNGLYAIQLLVVRKDQGVARTTVFVTVDNRPPTVSIQYPNPGEQLTQPAGGKLVFQADVQDDLGIEGIAFFLDGELLGTVFQAPYALSWAPRPGEHTLLVKATDRAGNTSQAEITFTIAP